jgi:hypothetical protein
MVRLGKNFRPAGGSHQLKTILSRAISGSGFQVHPDSTLLICILLNSKLA